MGHFAGSFVFKGLTPFSLRANHEASIPAADKAAVRGWREAEVWQSLHSENL
jgi:hypothetical protein